MGKMTSRRLRAALRYVLFHPDMSPQVLSEEWEISFDLALKICCENIGTVVGNLGVDIKEKDWRRIESQYFEQLTSKGKKK